MPDPTWVPPMRSGVSASRVVVGDAKSSTVAEFLQQRFPAVTDWGQRLQCGEVLDAAGLAVAADAPCPAGMLLWYWRSPPPEPRVPFELEILFQDEHLVVVDKPHFLPVTPGGRHLHETALVRLKHRLGIAELAPMHRLDADTAGVLLFTVQPATRHAYQSLLRDRQVQKVYEAIAPWRADLVLPMHFSCRLQQPAGDGFMQMQVVSGEPNAHTLIELIGRIEHDGVGGEDIGKVKDFDEPPLAHYRLTPSSGQKHQLRAQMSALGLPIVGDRIYPRLLPSSPIQAPDFTRPLQLLARQISFADPVIGIRRCFTSARSLGRVAGSKSKSG